MSTDFAEGLDERWLTIRTPRGEWLRTDGRGLVLRDNGHTIGCTANPAFVGVRQQHTDFTVETTVASSVAGERFGGLAFFQNEKHYLLFGRTDSAVVAVRADGPTALLASAPIGPDTAGSLRLRVHTAGGRCDLEYAWGDGPFVALARGVDTRNLSTVRARGFNGVIVGLYTGRLSAAMFASGE